MVGEGYVNTTKLSRCVKSVEVHQYVNIKDIECFALTVEGKGCVNIKSESIDVKSEVSNIFQKSR